MLATAKTFTLDGIGARVVEVEVHVQGGLPAFSVVGLPDAAVRESRERVRSALVNGDFEFPMRRITVNLAPADLPKVGPGLDLAIAAALLEASEQLAPGLNGLALVGELALDGAVRPVPGVLAMAEAARRSGIPTLAVPEANGGEAALVDGLAVVPVASLGQLKEYSAGSWVPDRPPPLAMRNEPAGLPDLGDLRGQPSVRRALEICAAGGHSLLIVGPPGAGKSLALRRLQSILPPLTREEALEVARIASVGGRLDGALPGARPFRAPHHTISAAGLIGGGNPPRPGEATLAHRGVLFLDELSEFSRDTLESLRSPMEDGSVVIARARQTVELPCRFTLVAAANPCPCGRGDDSEECSCPAHQVRRYQAKLSGALADRIDICLAVDQPSAEAMASSPGESSSEVRRRVVAARERQQRRLGPDRSNADLSVAELSRECVLAEAAARLLIDQHARLGLSGRGHTRVLRVSRTLADLEGVDTVEEHHVAEALRLRLREGPR